MAYKRAIRQAIVTTYKGATNSRGSRIVAKASAGRITVPYDDGLSVEENHIAAAKAFAVKWDWRKFGNWVTGVLPNGDYVHVLNAKVMR